MKKLSLILLILGLIFSQIILVSFNINHGFEYHKIWFRIIPLADYAGKMSTELTLTSAFVGYLLFIVFGVLNINKVKSPQTFKSFLMFTGIALVVCYFEITSLIEDYNSVFQGKHFRIGWLIFILGLWLYYNRYLKRK